MARCRAVPSSAAYTLPRYFCGVARINEMRQRMSAGFEGFLRATIEPNIASDSGVEKVIAAQDGAGLFT